MKTRREFLKTSAAVVGALGTLGSAGSLRAESRPAPAAAKPAPVGALKQSPVAGNVRLDRNNVIKLSNNLFQSPAERSKFLSNPRGYSETFFGGGLDAASGKKLTDIANMVADGLCCGGCGCGMPLKAVDLPARR